MNYSNAQVVFQEVPGEISLALSISGCPFKCKGCHSQETWNPAYGEPLDLDKLLDKYGALVSCVLFYGGEWHPAELKQHLAKCKQLNLKTCLYTGSNKPIRALLPYLDFIKIGRWVESYGVLGSLTSNQRFYRVDNEILTDLTHLFAEQK